MCLKTKIVCNKILKHICRNIMIPEYRYKKYYKNKKQLYNAIYRGYVRLHILGGGGCLVKNFGVYDKDRVEICDDICASAKGYEFLAYNMLR